MNQFKTFFKTLTIKILKKAFQKIKVRIWTTNNQRYRRKFFLNKNS